MDKEQARELIKETFETVFDKEKFVVFIKNLLNRIDESKAFHARGYVKESFKKVAGVIKTYERLGTYTDPNGKKIDIIITYLQKGYSLDHARVTQRNFAGRYLADRGEKNAGLFAFVSPDENDWRFSLVTMDYEIVQTKSGNWKGQEKFSQAKRWSFLVGKNEPNHTVQAKLYPLLKDDINNPTLVQLEDAFNIEKVTKEFFEKYRDLFIRTKEELDKVVENDPKIKADFDTKGVDTVNFAKKLLGQIVFLYFLQKKGWFGVGRDAKWGTGSKGFLRELFEGKHGKFSNFFNDILEPLFYEALRIDRRHDDDYYSRFNCKIPFLNGGLFDPINNYDWVHTDILLPNELFSNENKTKEGDTGDGILDILDRYNFTVKEDEPLEKEVAVDPEMLGKVFENLLEVKDRKSKGTYYTPREIVHYMCQQSLINYLYTELNRYHKLFKEKLFGKSERKISFQNEIISKEDIEMLIKYGERFGENEAVVEEKGKETETYKYKLPESIRKNAKLIDDKLSDIKVCDPAVGSGAFPVGMMTEIVKARNSLTTYIPSPLMGEDSPRGIKLHSKHSPIPQGGGEGEKESRTIYHFKRSCIEKSLYGVDIDPGAVEIAKLRLWLSLVVDERDIKNIKPLPNLDYKIMQGNSLISEFMGINFDSDKKQSSEKSIFKYETDKVIEQFQQKKDKFLNESNVTKKSKLKEEVETLLVKIFETKLKTQKTNYFNGLKDIEDKYSVVRDEKQRYELIKQDKDKLNKKFDFDLESAEKQLKEFSSGRKIKPFFLWNLYFSEVFLRGAKSASNGHDKGGFDVVIANPPYVVTKNFQNAERSLLKKKYNSALYQINLYLLFIEVAFNISRKGGFQSLIVPNSWLVNKTVSKFREFIIGNYTIEKIIDCTKANIFDATVLPIIYLARKIFVADRLSIELYRYYSHSFKYKTTLNKEEINNDNNFLINYQYDESAKK